MNHSTYDWTLDPRTEVAKSKLAPNGVERGTGNHVSVEFNLLYRFHSVISERDEKWTENMFRKIFPGTEPRDVSMHQMFHGMQAFAQETEHLLPHERTFDGLERCEDGHFNDEDLVKILKESIEDPAAAFGANSIPDVMKNIEILGIKQAREWQVCSLNEFRQFFGLKPHKTFADINPDPYIADTLCKLYDHPDMVELYPGLFVEECKPRMDPGNGLCKCIQSSLSLAGIMNSHHCL
jgi:hypothetical protein